MEWLTAVWNKINKPLPHLFVGAVIYFFAPTELRWAGLVFVAVGLAGAIEFLATKIRHWSDDWLNRRRLKRRLLILNENEKEVLRTQLERGEQTFYLNWHDYHGARRRLGDDREYRRLVGIYIGLSQKKILSMRTDHTVATLHINDDAWHALLKAARRAQ